MLITQGTTKKKLNIELSTGLNKGDGGYDVVGMEEYEDQIPAKRYRTLCGGPHEARSLL